MVTRYPGSLSGSELLSTQWLHLLRGVSKSSPNGRAYTQAMPVAVAPAENFVWQKGLHVSVEVWEEESAVEI